MEYTIDATNKKLGRLASEVAVILQGKKHATYNPRLAGTDRVIIKNGSKVEITGNKPTQKIYYHHSGHLGNLKEKSYEVLFAKSPQKVIWKTIYHMLPKNRLRSDRMRRLKIEL